MLNNLEPIRIEKIKVKSRKNSYIFVEIYKCSICNGELRIEKRRLKNHTGRCLKCVNIKLNTNPALNIFLSTYKSRAKRDNINYNLTITEFKLLINQNCDYCGSIPKTRQLKYGRHNKVYNLNCNGIDRVNSDIGYILENCVSCCKLCNFFKLNHSKIEFLDQIKKIYEFQLLKENKK